MHSKHPVLIIEGLLNIILIIYLIGIKNYPYL